MHDSGVKRHIQQQHLHSRIRSQLSDPAEVDDIYRDYDFPDDMDPLGLDEPNARAGQHPRVWNINYHPLLDGGYDSVNTPNTAAYHFHAGTPCNCDGHYLPPDSPPPPNPPPLPDDYSPYESREAFHLAEFLYSREQMSGVKIDELLAIMASMYNKEPPFHSHKDMYDMIDTTTHEDSPWKSFSVTYSGAMPDGDPPSWMTAKYDVWYRNLKVVLEHQLAIPDFKGEIDYAAKVVVDEDGHCEVCDLMSGQWVFEQLVSSSFLIAIEVANIY